jgi:general stress protein 26
MQLACQRKNPIKNERMDTVLKKILLTLPLLVVTLSLSGMAQVQSLLPGEKDSVLSATREIIAQQKYCALITLDSVGSPDVRTMNPFPPESDMTVWMATNSRSKKVEQIQKNPKVCLYYASHSQATGFVAIHGTAVLVDDMEEKIKRKRDYWTQAFPDWKYLLLIKVIPERVEVLNYKHGKLNDPITWSIPVIDLPQTK